MAKMVIKMISETEAQVTKAFAKNAVILGTDEYKLWKEYRKDFPDAKMVTKTIKKNPEKKTYKNKISPTRWKYTFSKLWNEFNCCYYNVKPFVFNAWYDEDYQEIFSLTEKIVQNLIL